VRYLSVCSGIEAASVAWHPLGWQPVAFSEIEAFPSAVLAHHYPTVPNWSDMTRYAEWPDANVDVLVGGTPCQSFSVAGLRKGLDDPRGNLMLTFGAIAKRYRPCWLVWENVPGVLSSDGGRDFGTFLGMLAELGYGFAYRVLDAQYVRVDGHAGAVPQRRRRVFVVGHLGDWRRAAAVLFERESLSGHPAPRREAGQAAPTIPSRSTAGGGLGTDFDCDGWLVPQGRGGDVALPLTAREGKGPNSDCDSGNIIAHARETGKGFWTDDGTASLRAEPGGMPENIVAHSLRADGFDASEDGTGRGTPLVPVPIDMRQVSRHALGTGSKHGAASAAVFTNGGQGQPAHTFAVRRLTPEECEALQAFPRGYTDIPWRKKLHAPDGPRYKALGNSMACNVMRWIGQRIALVEEAAAAESEDA
jgi:DNA (cytosine-5)-methyltransferase 1